MRLLTDKFSPDIFCVAEANVTKGYKQKILVILMTIIWNLV